MKRFYKGLVLGAFAITFAFCAKDDDVLPSTPGAGDPNVEVQDNVTVSDEDLNDLIASISASQIVFDGDHPQLLELSVGDVLVSSTHEKAQFGYAVEVVEIQQDGSETTLTFEQAALTDIFKEANVDLVYTFSEQDTLTGRGVGDGFLLDGSYSFPGLGGTLGLTCRFNPSVLFDLNISESVLQYAKIGLALGVDYAIDASVSSPSGELKIPLYPERAITPKVIFVGWVPIVITPKWGVYGVGSYTSNVNLSVDVAGTSDFDAYVEYTEALGWQQYAQKSLTNSLFEQEADDESDLSIMLGVQPELSITLYNYDGAKTTLSTRLYADGSISLSQNSGDDDECFGLGLRVGGDFNVEFLDKSLLDFETVLFEERRSLLEGDACSPNFLQGTWVYSNGAEAYYDGRSAFATGTKVPSNNAGFNFVIGELYWEELQQLSTDTWSLNHILRNTDGEKWYAETTFTQLSDSTLQADISGFGATVLRKSK